MFTEHSKRIGSAAVALMLGLALGSSAHATSPAGPGPEEAGGWGPLWTATATGNEAARIEVIPLHGADHMVEVRLFLGHETLTWSEGLLQNERSGRLESTISLPEEIGSRLAVLTVLVTASNPITGQPLSTRQTDRLLVHRNKAGKVVDVTQEQIDAQIEALSLDGHVVVLPAGWELER